MNRAKSYIKKAGLASLFMGVSIVVGECSLRQIGIQAKQLSTVSALEYDRVPGMWEPNQRLRKHDKPQLAHDISINALGLRGAEVESRKTKHRVLFVGDSNTFGDYVDEDETLPAWTQAYLGEKFEVLNGGVSGSTISDQLEYLRRLLALKPDLVIVVFFENDLTDLDVDPPQHEQLARNRRLKSGFFSPVFEIVRDTAIFNLTLRALKAVQIKDHISPSEPSKDDSARNWAGLVDEYGHYAVRLVQLVESAGARVFFAAMPPHQVLAQEAGSGRIPDVARLLRHASITMLDLTGPLRETGLSVENLFLLPHDGHPSSDNYAAAARALIPEIQSVMESGGPAQRSH